MAFVLDDEKQILDVLLGDGIAAELGWKRLVGRSWTDVVTIESQPKVENLVREVGAGQKSKVREINLRVDGVGEVPLRVNAVRIDDAIIALGHDLRPVAALQQRLVHAQQASDREYARLRQADMRYRVLFHVTSECVLVVDTTTGRVLEANPAAAALLEESPQDLQAATFTDLLDTKSRATWASVIAKLEAGPPSVEVQVDLDGKKLRDLRLSASMFRQGGATLALVRLARSGSHKAPITSASRVLAVVEAMPDGLVIVDTNLEIMAANSAFCEMVLRANERQVVGLPLERWLGRPGVDLNIILSNVKRHGSVRNFSTILQSDYGNPQQVTVTAVSALDGKVPCYGFSIRAVTGSVAAMSAPPSPRSVEQLKELVGRVSLKELVRESADMVEKLCIEAALDVSNNNRASAAQLLGLSRQGLYSKLRRYGLEEFEAT